jgi:hypothetical protein
VPAVQVNVSLGPINRLPGAGELSVAGSLSVASATLIVLATVRALACTDAVPRRLRGRMRQNKRVREI